MIQWNTQPSVSFGPETHTHTHKVNSNTLGLCALHQTGAVCTKTANPELKAATAAAVRSGHASSPLGKNHTKTRFKKDRGTYGGWKYSFIRPGWCVNASRGLLGPVRSRNEHYIDVVSAAFMGYRKYEGH